MTREDPLWIPSMTKEKGRYCSGSLPASCVRVMTCIVLQLSQFDPIRTISLHQHLVSKLEQCVSVHGPAMYSDLINKVDLVVREQFLEFVPLKAAAQLLNIFLHEDTRLE